MNFCLGSWVCNGLGWAVIVMLIFLFLLEQIDNSAYERVFQNIIIAFIESLI